MTRDTKAEIALRRDVDARERIAAKRETLTADYTDDADRDKVKSVQSV